MKHSLRFILFTSIITTSSTCLAESPKVSVGGTLGFQTGFTKQKNGFDAGARNYGMRNDTEISIEATQKAEAGWIYGAHVELEADVTADARGEGTNADKTFLFAEGSFGRVEAGNNAGAEQAMAVNAASIARASGGIDGDDEFYINRTGTSGTADFIIHPDLPSANTGGITEDASKVTYYTPIMSGIQLGLSYTPDEGDGGQQVTRIDNNSNFENVFGAGLTYNGDIQDIKVSAALVGETGNAEISGTQDMNAWEIGSTLTWRDVTVAASYADWGDSGLATTSNEDSSFWSAGMAYEVNKAGFSATYFHSDHASDTYETLVIGADYQLADGLTPYVETSFFEADEGSTTNDNKGNVVLIGTYINF
jgi:hypothetical protein